MVPIKFNSSLLFPSLKTNIQCKITKVNTRRAHIHVCDIYLVSIMLITYQICLPRNAIHCKPTWLGIIAFLSCPDIYTTKRFIEIHVTTNAIVANDLLLLKHA